MSYDTDNNQHVKFGNTIRRTQNDFNPSGSHVIDIAAPKEGLFYLQITIVKQCNTCCGSSAGNPFKCDVPDDKGRPEWQTRTPLMSYSASIQANVPFNTCKCDCL